MRSLLLGSRWEQGTIRRRRALGGIFESGVVRASTRVLASTLPRQTILPRLAETVKDLALVTPQAMGATPAIRPEKRTVVALPSVPQKLPQVVTRRKPLPQSRSQSRTFP